MSLQCWLLRTNRHRESSGTQSATQEHRPGQASVYKWKDKEGREWKGGLYKPGNYKSGQRYPLVIQTHGFGNQNLDPPVFSEAFAARALAAKGIVVLQVEDGRCPFDNAL